MVPQNAGTLKAGTLLYSGTYSIVPPPNQTLVIEIYISTDGGQTWHYLSTPVQGASPVNGTNAYNAVWEPEFEVDNSGNLVMFWSDETDPCCSQKIAQMDSSDGIFWGDQKNTVASNINADRPGMSVVSKLPNGHYFMSYEDCGPAACTVFTRTSPDGWDFGVPSTIANAAVTATGQYFTHTPANVWSPSPHDPYGEILLIGQVLLESNGQVSGPEWKYYFCEHGYQHWIRSLVYFGPSGTNSGRLSQPLSQLVFSVASISGRYERSRTGKRLQQRRRMRALFRDWSNKLLMTGFGGLAKVPDPRQ
jgi:hypothetical protein